MGHSLDTHLAYTTSNHSNAVLSSLQDLSSFAMPLLDSDVNDVTMATDPDDSFRPRSGSGGIRNFFRKKHKSGGDDSRSSSRGSSPGTTPGSKVKTFFDVIRPRSKSDAASAPAPNSNAYPKLQMKTRSGNVDFPETLYENDMRHRTGSASMSDRLSAGTPPTRHSLGSYGNPQMTAMGQLLADSSPQGERCRNQAGFMDRFRSRAYSDPKPRSSAAAAARSAMLQRRVSDLTLNKFPLLISNNNWFTAQTLHKHLAQNKPPKKERGGSKDRPTVSSLFLVHIPVEEIDLYL